MILNEHSLALYSRFIRISHSRPYSRSYSCPYSRPYSCPYSRSYSRSYSRHKKNSGLSTGVRFTKPTRKNRFY